MSRIISVDPQDPQDPMWYVGKGESYRLKDWNEVDGEKQLVDSTQSQGDAYRKKEPWVQLADEKWGGGSRVITVTRQ